MAGRGRGKGALERKASAEETPPLKEALKANQARERLRKVCPTRETPSSTESRNANQAIGHLNQASSSTEGTLPSTEAPSATTPWHECADVLESIFFRFLGLADALRCRCVCKTWHRTLGNIQHIRRRFCCLMHDETDDVFWLRPEDISMHVCPRTPSSTCWKSALNFRVPRLFDECTLVASAHGLLCFHLHAGNFERTLPLLVVCNSVTGGHRTLPRFSRIDELESVGMHVNLLQNTYTIFVIGKSASCPGKYFHDNGDPVKTPFYVSHVEIYCSKARSWTYNSYFITDQGVEKGRIAWWQGRFYWMVKKPDSSLNLLVYDMKKREWIETQVDSFTSEISGSALSPFVWKDSLVCKLHYNRRSKYWHVQPSSTNQNWTPLYFLETKYSFGLESEKKPTSMHVAAHFSEGFNGLNVCIFNPYSFAPTETPVSSSQSYIVRRKRLSGVPNFPFTPCFSCQV